MNDPIPPSHAHGSRRPHWPAYLVVTLIVIAFVVVGVQQTQIFTRSQSSIVRQTSPVADSPYLNTKAGVQYVGDAACAGCHREISESYRRHPMGRSLAPLAEVSSASFVSPKTPVQFDSQGLHYSVEQRDGRIWHKSVRLDEQGHELAKVEAEVSYALGSGTRGTSFLINRDGYLFQSPIAWFAQQGRWDISPGYGEVVTRPNFERPIQPDCLFCHANQFHPVPGALNRYKRPVFDGHAIGCERCHGPGQLHVREGGQSSDPDLTIVNPSRLPIALRDSVCEQCHLQGSFRFARAGHEPLDYRPGLPLHQFLAVFLRKNSSTQKFEAVGHSEQMQSSRCYIATEGRLGCVSCHDPHRLPEPDTKAAYYRSRCLECHATHGCTLPLDVRNARGQGDDCVHCHMPKPLITNIPHTAATDHRITVGSPRSKSDSQSFASQPPKPGDVPLVNYHRSLMTEAEERESARDTGVALAWAARILRSTPQISKLAASQALARLEPALQAQPDDLMARESLAHVFTILGRPEDAIQGFDGVLSREPRREMSLRSAGRVLTRLQRFDAAIVALEKSIEVNPWQSDYHFALASVRRQKNDWPRAIASCKEALRLNPELVEARSLLIECYWHSAQRDKADAEYQIMLHLYPASREVWQHWYDQLRNTARHGSQTKKDDH